MRRTAGVLDMGGGCGCVNVLMYHITTSSTLIQAQCVEQSLQPAAGTQVCVLVLCFEHLHDCVPTCVYVCLQAGQGGLPGGPAPVPAQLGPSSSQATPASSECRLSLSSSLSLSLSLSLG